MNDTIYQAWHRKLGHAEYRLRITMAGYGADEAAAEAFLEGFEEAHPEVGAVISQDQVEETITATFSLSATNDQHAFDLGVTIWIESGVASGLSPNEVVRSEIELVQPESAQVSEATAVPA
jgi:hypothetical protein